MFRRLHAFPGLFLSIFTVLLALSGTILAVSPVLERSAAFVPAAGKVTVAALAEKLVDRFPGLEQIKRKASGQIVVSYYDGEMPMEAKVDPLTGALISPYEPPEFFVWVANFHHSFLMGDSAVGRGAAGLGALALLFLTVSGAVLLSIRMGGWRMIFKPVRGNSPQKFHVRTGRIVQPVLFISALTGLLMSLSFFGVLSNDMGMRPNFPDVVDGGEPAPIGSLKALQNVDLRDFRSLVFPYEGDPEEAFELSTRRGGGYVDQATGELLTWLPHSSARKFYEFVLMVHTGEGLWWLGMITGLAALAVPFLTSSGIAVWWHQRRSRTRIRRNVAVADADTVILVGSEGNATWGFAHTLQNALSGAGFFVHVAPMNQINSAHTGDKRMFILTATYGDGSAPDSAYKFIDEFQKVEGGPQRGVTVLGFGDREFGHYCAFAHDVEAAIRARGWRVFAPLETVNRQSAQEFSRWGDLIGDALDVDLRLVHIAETPRSQPLALTSREDFGDKVHAPTSIMRFATPEGGRVSPWRRLTGRGGVGSFEAGDLVGIVPPGSTMPRYYSLGSSSYDGFLEIAVRKHTHGVCSGYLYGLKPGDVIHAFVRPNPEFHMHPGKTPVILMGAGCGIGPLAGFIRANRVRRPIRLYFGVRDPDSDFLYQREIQTWLAEGKLGTLVVAFSRTEDRSYLQDKIIADAEILQNMILAGAQIMVVGGREMAQGVLTALDEVLAPCGFSAASLQMEGRYVEDIY